MNIRHRKQRILGWAQEAKQADQNETEVDALLQKWKRRTKWLAAAFAASAMSVVPFLSGWPLHDYWDILGSRLLLLSMLLISPVLWVAATTYNFWRYLRAIRQTHKKYAPPGSRHRTDAEATVGPVDNGKEGPP
jgi:hypothetical protein